MVSLCLVSKQFLPHARSSLYHRPIPILPFTWDRALNFATSLSSRNGQLVRSLEGIVELVGKIGNIAQPPFALPFQLRGYTKAFSLYYSILSSCPHLLQVELIFNSTNHMNKLFKALEHSKLTLKTVKLTNTNSAQDYHMTDELVHRALRHESLRNVENLHLGDVVLSSPANFAARPLTPIALSSCHINLKYASFKQVQPFLQQNVSSLRIIHLEIGYFKDDADVIWFLEYLPANLQQLELVLAATLARSQPLLSEYETIHRPPLASESFSRFSNLRKLTLIGHFLEPRLLEVLSVGSPQLNQLNLFESRWVAPGSSNTTRLATYISGILDPSRAITLLSYFNHVKEVCLGFLPTIGVGRYASLELEMERKGIELDWDVCGDGRYCPFCGEIHS